MKKIILGMSLLLPYFSTYAAQDCGAVKILEITSGPYLGSMMRVDKVSCGKQGWVCLDPDGERMSINVAKQVYSLALSKHTTDKQVTVSAYDDGVYANACGGSASAFPVIFDLRTFQ